MSNFNLDNYETVKERKKRFYEKYPDGSLVSEIVHFEKGWIIIKGMVFRNKEEQEKGLPSGVGYAEEYKGQGGFANKTSWCENCDESAIGRGLDNFGMSGGKCSREEMEKVKRHENDVEKETGDLDKALIELGECDNLKSLGLKAKELNEKYNWTETERNEMRSIYKDIANGFTKN